MFITENSPEGRKLKFLMRSMGYTRHIQESMGNMRKYGTSECHETIKQEKKQWMQVLKLAVYMAICCCIKHFH